MITCYLFILVLSGLQVIALGHETEIKHKDNLKQSQDGMNPLTAHRLHHTTAPFPSLKIITFRLSWHI